MESAGGEREPRLTTLLRDVPTCSLDTPIRELREPLEVHPFVLAVGDRDVVLGKVLARSAAAAGDEDLARDHLVEGPTTVRANEKVEDLAERMRRADTGSVVVTTGEGRLLGVFFRADAEAPHDH